MSGLLWSRFSPDILALDFWFSRFGLHLANRLFCRLSLSLSLSLYVLLSVFQVGQVCRWGLINGPQSGLSYLILRDKTKPVLHCDSRVRWKAASDLRFGAALYEPETPSFDGVSGDVGP